MLYVFTTTSGDANDEYSQDLVTRHGSRIRKNSHKMLCDSTILPDEVLLNPLTKNDKTIVRGPLEPPTASVVAHSSVYLGRIRTIKIPVRLSNNGHDHICLGGVHNVPTDARVYGPVDYHIKWRRFQDQATFGQATRIHVWRTS